MARTRAKKEDTPKESAEPTPEETAPEEITQDTPEENPQDTPDEAPTDPRAAAADAVLKRGHRIACEDGMIALYNERYAERVHRCDTLDEMLSFIADSEAKAQAKAEAEAKAQEAKEKADAKADA